MLKNLYWAMIELLDQANNTPQVDWGEEWEKISNSSLQEYGEAANITRLEVSPGDWQTLLQIRAFQLDLEQELPPKLRCFKEEEINQFLRGAPLKELVSTHEEFHERYKPSWATHRHKEQAVPFAEVVAYPRMSDDPFPEALSLELYERAKEAVIKTNGNGKETDSYEYYRSLKIRANEMPKTLSNWEAVERTVKMSILFNLLKRVEKKCYK